MSKNKALELKSMGPGGNSGIFELRGYFVMLASKVAEVFNVETRVIVQNITRNNKGDCPLFSERYAFQINKDELEFLRSLGVISKAGRGGSRALPWVVSRKGAIRLATLMKVPEAMKAADTFVDVFDEVLVQISRGQKVIEISNPSRITVDQGQLKHINKLRAKMTKAIDELLNTTVNSGQNITVKDELGQMAQESVSRIKEWLRSKKIGNEKIEAETCLLLEQARDICERRQSELASAALDRESKTLENFEKKLDLVEKLLAMHNKLEPNAVINLVGQYVDNSHDLAFL